MKPKNIELVGVYILDKIMLIEIYLAYQHLLEKQSLNKLPILYKDRVWETVYLSQNSFDRFSKIFGNVIVFPILNSNKNAYREDEITTSSILEIKSKRFNLGRSNKLEDNEIAFD